MGAAERESEHNIDPALGMELLELPDDVLVEVLSYLEDPRQLLGLRILCRRLRDVALRPELWRHRDLSQNPEDVALTRAVLLLVPCVAGLTIQRHQLAELAASPECRCAVGSLDVNEVPYDRLVAIVERQSELGRLESLSFHSWMELLTEDRLHALLHAMEANDMKSLSASEAVLLLDAPELVPVEVSVRPFLRYLDFEGWFVTQLLESLLRSQASSLEVVYVESVVDPENLQPVMGGLTNVILLKCPWLPDMRTLLQSAALRSLSLGAGDMSKRSSPKDGPSLDNALEFLRGATQLQSLTLVTRGSAIADLGPKVVQALASSGSSVLQSLILRLAEDNSEWDPQPLAAYLAGLSQLRSLVLGVPPTADFLLALSEAIAPCLRVVSVTSDRCLHLWLHLGLAELLHRKRHLHFMMPLYAVCAETDPLCEACSQGCHPALRETRQSSSSAVVALFHHQDADPPCSWCRSCDSDIVWLNV